MPPNFQRLFDTIWLVPATLLWAVGIVLVSAWHVRRRFPARRPGTTGDASPYPGFIVLAAGIGSLLAVKWYFGLAGLGLGVICLAAVYVATLVAGSFCTQRDHSVTIEAYSRLVQLGLGPAEALREVSRVRHPELNPATHTEVASRCGDINRLFFFYDTCAELGQKTLSDAHVRACLDSSTPVRRGSRTKDIYHYRKDHAAYNRALESYQAGSTVAGQDTVGSGAEQVLVADFIGRASHGLAHDNFEYIAVHAGTFWAVLNESYPSRFRNENARLAVCAYLTLQKYLEQERLKARDLELAVLLARNGECGSTFARRAHESRSLEMRLYGSEYSAPNLYEPRVLLNLTLQLEVLAFCADNVEMLPEAEIIDIVIDKKAVIAHVLTDTEKSIREGRLPAVEPIRSIVADVLASPRFASTMIEIGISDVPET